MRFAVKDLPWSLKFIILKKSGTQQHPVFYLIFRFLVVRSRIINPIQDIEREAEEERRRGEGGNLPTFC